jgi:hypothetical protein
MSREYVRDMVYVNVLEKRLGRKLEKHEIYHGEDEELELTFPDGHREFHIIPSLVFPTDVLSGPGLYIQIGLEALEEELNPFSGEIPFWEEAPYEENEE